MVSSSLRCTCHLLVEGAPPPKEEAAAAETPKDAESPVQQVEKKLPEPPAPSESPKEAKKGKDIEKLPKEEMKAPPPAPVAGSRNETRVRLLRWRICRHSFKTPG